MSARNHGGPRFVAYLSAPPGFFVLGALTDERGFPSEAIKYPVVAVALEEGCLAPYPITMEGVITENEYILQPDGSVERPGIDGFANVDDWLANQQQAWHAKAGKVGRA